MKQSGRGADVLDLRPIRTVKLPGVIEADSLPAADRLRLACSDSPVDEVHGGGDESAWRLVAAVGDSTTYEFEQIWAMRPHH